MWVDAPQVGNFNDQKWGISVIAVTWDRGEAAARLRTLLQAGIDCFIDLTQRDEGLEPVYVHCWGGIGRTGTVVGCWLVRHGMTGDEALAEFASPGRWFNRPCCSRWAGAT